MKSQTCDSEVAGLSNIRVISLSKLFTLVVLEPTQPSIPLREVYECSWPGHRWVCWTATAGPKAVRKETGGPLIAPRHLQLLLISMQRWNVNRCCLGIPVSGSI